MEKGYLIGGKRTSLVILPLGVIWIVCSVIFGIYDLQISKAVVNYNSIIGNFTANYGEVPGYIIIVISLSIYLNEQLKDRNLKFLFIMVSAILWYLIMDRLFHQLLSSSWIIILSILSILLLFAYIEQTDLDLEDYVNSAIVCIKLAILNPLLFVLPVKALWGRVRFRNLSSDYSEFTPFYLPQGYTGNFSFPSGHAAMGWMLLVTPLFVKNPFYKRVALVGSIIWGTLVAVGRVLIGAHYASDILYSSMMGIIVFIHLVSSEKEVDVL